MDEHTDQQHDPSSVSRHPLAYAAPPPGLHLSVILARLAVALAGLWLVLIFAFPSYPFPIDVVIVASAAAATGLVIAGAWIAPMDDHDARRRVRRVMWVAFLPAVLTLGGLLLLPRLGRAREPANHLKCASNLRQIGQGIQMYANENAGAFPPSFDDLITQEDLTSDVFICPSSSDERATGPTTQAVAAAVVTDPGHCSYDYFGAGLTTRTVTAKHVLACEHMCNHGDAGMNLLYGDFSVDWLDKAEANRVLAELKAGHNPPAASDKTP